MTTAIAFVMHHLRCFSAIASVHMSLGKSASVVKGDTRPTLVAQLKDIGLQLH